MTNDPAAKAPPLAVPAWETREVRLHSAKLASLLWQAGQEAEKLIREMHHADVEPDREPAPGVEWDEMLDCLAEWGQHAEALEPEDWRRRIPDTRGALTAEARKDKG